MGVYMYTCVTQIFTLPQIGDYITFLLFLILYLLACISMALVLLLPQRHLHRVHSPCITVHSLFHRLCSLLDDNFHIPEKEFPSACVKFVRINSNGRSS